MRMITEIIDLMEGKKGKLFMHKFFLMMAAASTALCLAAGDCAVAYGSAVSTPVALPARIPYTMVRTPTVGVPVIQPAPTNPAIVSVPANNQSGAPRVTGMNPASGAAGTTVILTGTNFSTTPANNLVLFENRPNVALRPGQIVTMQAYQYTGVPAVVKAATATALTVIVPNGAMSGIVSVRTISDTASSPTYFTVGTAIPASTAPTITGFNPSAGPAGTTVTITGTNFAATPTNNMVKFNGIPATVTSATNTSLSVIVPNGAVSGPITVTTSAGTATSPGSFTLTASSSSSKLSITGISPITGAVGTTVIISGTYFNNPVVTFNGIPATITSKSPVSIQVIVPNGLATGSYPVKVTTTGACVLSNNTTTCMDGGVATAPVFFTVSAANTSGPVTPGAAAISLSGMIYESGSPGNPVCQKTDFVATRPPYTRTITEECRNSYYTSWKDAAGRSISINYDKYCRSATGETAKSADSVTINGNFPEGSGGFTLSCLVSGVWPFGGNMKTCRDLGISIGDSSSQIIFSSTPITSRNNRAGTISGTLVIPGGGTFNANNSCSSGGSSGPGAPGTPGTPGGGTGGIFPPTTFCTSNTLSGGNWVGTWKWSGPSPNQPKCSFSDGGSIVVAFNNATTCPRPQPAGNLTGRIISASGVQSRDNSTCKLTHTDTVTTGTIKGDAIGGRDGGDIKFTDFRIGGLYFSSTRASWDKDTITAEITRRSSPGDSKNWGSGTLYLKRNR